MIKRDRAANSFIPFWGLTGKHREERDLLKVATFNINNINKRLDNLLAFSES
jgi:hypothetical protein